MMRLAISIVLISIITGCVQTPEPLPRRNPVPPPEIETEPITVRGEASSGIGIIPRSSWTQRNPRMDNINSMGRITRLTIHHCARVNRDTSWSAAVNSIRGIQRAHFDNGWADIGYHYIIDPHGRIWEGRSMRYQGAHVRHSNEGNIGIVLLGNFDSQTLNANQRNSLKELTDHLCHIHRIPMSRVYTHGELYNTRCPGANLQRYVDEIRRRSIR